MDQLKWKTPKTPVPVLSLVPYMHDLFHAMFVHKMASVQFVVTADSNRRRK